MDEEEGCGEEEKEGGIAFLVQKCSFVLIICGSYYVRVILLFCF